MLQSCKRCLEGPLFGPRVRLIRFVVSRPTLLLVEDACSSQCIALEPLMLPTCITPLLAVQLPWCVRQGNLE